MMLMNTLRWKLFLTGLFIALILLVSFNAHRFWFLTSPSPNVQCPPGYRHIPSRTQQIQERLKVMPETAQLLRALRSKPIRYCYKNNAPSVVTTQGVMLLDTRQSLNETAARVGHLLQHLNNPITFVPGENCERQVKQALVKEAQAYTLELRIRKELKVKNPILQLAFTPSFWRLPASKQTPFLVKHFQESRYGERGVGSLLADYRRRCRKRQRTSPNQRKALHP